VTTALEVLQEARNILESPGRWCQLHYALNDQGTSTDPLDPRAQRFCLLGAIERAAHHLGFPYWTRREPDLLAPLYELVQGPITEFNDAPERKHKDILDLLDQTIKKLEEDHADGR
jgi:hypothetical protein